MTLISGRRALLEVFFQEGVDMVFGNPGTTELPLMDALAGDDRFRYILGLQEAVVMGMADGFAQASGRLAVANLHAAPGLGNAMGMLFNAKKAAAPVLAIAGQHEQRLSFSEPILDGDLPVLARPLVKWSYEVRRIGDLPMAVHRAAKVALSLPTGPVFLSLPLDVLLAESDIDLGAPSRIAARIRGDDEAIVAASQLLAQSANPILLAGDAVIQSDAYAETIGLAELLGAPVYAETVANTASFPASHSLFRGTMERLGPAIHRALEGHDLLISIGADLFTLSLPSDVELLPPNLKIVHLDVDPWELGKNFPTDVAILGDPKSTLPELCAAVAERMDAGGRRRAKLREAEVATAIAAERAALVEKARDRYRNSPVNPLALLHAIGATLPKNAVVVEEALSSVGGIRQLMPSDDPKSFFGMRGGGIGWGIPAAIGIKLALPERPVVAVIGDGSAMYSIQGLWTAAHYKMPVVFVILNNSSYRLLKQRTRALSGSSAQRNEYVGMDLLDPLIDFPALAKSLGVAAYRATSVADSIDLLKEGLNGDRPILIDVDLERQLG